MGSNADVDVGLYDQRETRGNGLYSRPHAYQVSANLSSDQRNTVTGTIGQQFGWDEKAKREMATQAGVSVKPLSWMEWQFDAGYQRFRNQEAWVDTIHVSGFTRSIFAD